MGSDNFQKTLANLKKSVALMVKNQVPTTPVNYALWYTYIGQTQLLLNQEIDSVIKQYGYFLPSHNETLYQRHIATENEAANQELNASLQEFIGNLIPSVHDVTTETESFQKTMDRNIETLENLSEEIITHEKLVGSLNNAVTEVKQSTDCFNQQLHATNREIDHLKKLIADVQRDALYDSLSNLLNRGAFDKDIASFCNSGSPNQLCLVLVDIDNFKEINDQYGHTFGDTVIRMVARFLQMSSQEGISAYRYGGEEFALLVPNRPLREVSLVVERLRRLIQNRPVNNIKTGELVEVTASFGIAAHINGESAISLIDNADRQLYAAKKLGKNQVQPF